jgi:nucleotide-binding universal stress UspA family protein
VRILVPIDGAAPAQRALAHALTIARGREDALIILVNVQSAETLDVSDVSGVVSATADRKLAAHRSAHALRGAVAMCREAGVRYETRSELGPIAETIGRLSHELQTDQIVMGTRGHDAVRRLLLGSVATKVVQLVSVPVTLVK